MTSTRLSARRGTRSSRSALTGALLALGLVLAACGSGTDAASDPSAGQASGASEQSASAASGSSDPGDASAPDDASAPGDASAAGSSPSDGTTPSGPTSESEKSSAASGSASASVTFPLTLADAQGQQHTFDEPITHIGCVWSGCEETLADLGIVPAAAWVFPGSSGKLMYPIEVPANIDDLGGATSPEAWAAAGAELIVVRGPSNPDYQAYEAVAPVFYLYAPGYDDSDFPHAGDAYRKNLELLGQITGQPGAAQQAIDRFDAFMTELDGFAPPDAADTTIAAVWSKDAGSWTLVGPNTPFCRALDEYGWGHCVQSSARDAATWQINAEAFLALQPDWLAYLSGTDGTETDWVNRSDAIWDKLAAVQNKHVYNANPWLHCCSLRSMAVSLQEYGYHVWGKDSGLADPGAIKDYDYSKYQPGDLQAD